MRPAASNVKIDMAGVEVYDQEPKQLPNLYHGMPVRMYGRYRGSNMVDVRVQAEINGAPIDQTVQVQFPETAPANPEIERMWAWQKVDRLLKEADRASSRSSVVDEIVRLGESYSIVTEYTSFLVLENDSEYQRWNIERKNLLRTSRDRKQQQLVRNRLEALREKALADLGPTQQVAKPQADKRLALPKPVDQVATRNATPPAPPRTTNRDLDFSPRPSGPRFGGGGGGAFDPITGAIALGLTGLGAAASRRRRKNQ